jgi:hypothetical protein
MSTPLVATLLYHEVCEHPAESGFVRASALPYKHTPRAFAQHLDVIAQTGAAPELVSGFEPVPGGDISTEVLESAAGSNLLYVFTSEPQLTPARLDPAWVFGPVCIENSTPVERVRRLAMGRSWARERALRRAGVSESRRGAGISPLREHPDRGGEACCIKHS